MILDMNSIPNNDKQNQGKYGRLNTVISYYCYIKNNQYSVNVIYATYIMKRHRD